MNVRIRIRNNSRNIGRYEKQPTVMGSGMLERLPINDQLGISRHFLAFASRVPSRLSLSWPRPPETVEDREGILVDT